MSEAKKRRHEIKRKAQRVYDWWWNEGGGDPTRRREDLEYEAGLTRDEADAVYKALMERERSPITKHYVMDSDRYGATLWDSDTFVNVSREHIEAALRKVGADRRTSST